MNEMLKYERSLPNEVGRAPEKEPNENVTTCQVEYLAEERHSLNTIKHSTPFAYTNGQA